MDIGFLYETLITLLPGVPLTLKLTFSSVALGAMVAVLLALLRNSDIPPLSFLVRGYVWFFRSTPLLVQIFLIYYGLGQFVMVRTSILWPILRDPYWCAVIALTLNTAAYGCEIIRGGLQSVPHGQVEAAMACGMNRFQVMRRIVLPIAIRQALPAYGSEIIIMVKATALTSIITLLEVTGLAAKLISETYRAIEVFIVAGAIYLALNFIITRLVQYLEYRLTPHLRPAVPVRFAGQGDAA